MTDGKIVLQDRIWHRERTCIRIFLKKSYRLKSSGCNGLGRHAKILHEKTKEKTRDFQEIPGGWHTPCNI